MITIAKYHEEKIEIKKSLFIACAKMIDSEKAYYDFIKEIKHKYPNATHYCSACLSESFSRSNDDNEPAKTAGVPILSAIMKSELMNVAIIVVRYYGGIKLGASGLIKAYSNAASTVVNNATKMEICNYLLYELILDYKKANQIMNFLKNHSLNLTVYYDEMVRFEFLSKSDLSTKLSALLKEEITLKELGYRAYKTYL